MKNFFYRIFIMTAGLFLFALGIVLTLKANVGYAPWDVFHYGFAETVGISFGQTSILIGLVILLVLMLFKEKLGLGSIANMILIGVFIDVLLFINIIPELNNLVLGILMLIGGLFTVALGTYFYIKSAFGIGPRDNLMVVFTRATRIPVGICRSIVEVAVTIGGYFLGGLVGIGTLISVVAIGVCVQIVFRLFKFDINSVKHESIYDTLKNLKNGYR